MPADVQYAAATSGGGRLGPAAAVLGVCLGGAGAAVCATGGALPVVPPLIAHVRARTGRPPPGRLAPVRRRPQRHAPVRGIAVAAAATPAAARPTATPVRRVAHASWPTRPSAATAARREFGFEGTAPAATATPAPRRPGRRARRQRRCGIASSGAAGSEFGFERGG